MNIPVVNVLKTLNHNQIDSFVPYMLDNNLTAEKQFMDSDELNFSEYNMHDFKEDNQKVMEWFSTLQQAFDNKTLVATGSRSFNASYTESDLECAIVSENFDDFLNFCRFLNTRYSEGHHFTALKTLAGLPLLIIKGDTGFSCPELSKRYNGKTLPQLEVTFRHPAVHDTIQKAGTNFFENRDAHELESYVFNKRYIELLSRNVRKEAQFEGKSLKKVLGEFKGALAAALKCLPPGQLQETPDFNQDAFANTIKPKTIIHDSMTLGLNFYKKGKPSDETIQTEKEANHLSSFNC